MAYGSLPYGVLTGTFTQDVDFGSDNWRARADEMGSIEPVDTLAGPEFFPRDLRVVEALKGLATPYGRGLPQLALRCAISNPFVSTALVGCRTVAEADVGDVHAIFARNGVSTVAGPPVEGDLH